MEPQLLQLFHEPADRLRLTVSDRSYVTVKPMWAAPLSRPNQYLALLDGKDEEITTIVDPKSLTAESLAAVEKEIRARYLSATVKQIVDARVEFGATYWIVDTDRGRREFVTQSLQENAQWLGEQQLLLLDVDGNRFEIPDVGALDEKSQQFLDAIL